MSGVAIVGGGMVGVSLALALARRLPRLNVTLLESFPLPAPGSTPSYTPSFDARSTALSYSSALLYQEWGAWDLIAEHGQPIQSIHVSEQGRFGSTLMQTADYGWPALGFVVENSWLGSALLRQLEDTGVEVLSPVRVLSAEVHADGARLQLEDAAPLDSQLLVVADGAESKLREALGIGRASEDYRQHALIANVGHRQSHGGRAYERFTPRGPIAMLPLPDGVGHRSALVWTLPPEDANTLLEAPAAEFLAALQREFGYRLGRLERVGERHGYPLALLQAEEQVRSGVVVMGNAAHALHPVAGQGFNLALRDVACLVASLAEASDKGLSPGQLSVLQSYRQRQAADQRNTTAFSDRLPGLFMHRDPALSVLRDLGLFALDIAPALKREFVRHTAGIAASAGYRDVRP